MKKYNFLYFPLGTDKIIKQYNINKNFLLKCESDVRRIVQLSADNLKNENGQCFLTALTNFVLFKLAVLQRHSLNTEEERYLALFGRVLSRNDVDKMSENQIKILSEDFCIHFFWDVTADKGNRNHMYHKHNVPVELLKIVGYISLNQENSNED